MQGKTRNTKNPLVKYGNYNTENQIITDNPLVNYGVFYALDCQGKTGSYATP